MTPPAKPKRGSMLLLLGIILNVACLVWVGILMPSTPAEGHRNWMTWLGIILFCLGMPVSLAGFYYYFKQPQP